MHFDRLALGCYEREAQELSYSRVQLHRRVGTREADRTGGGDEEITGDTLRRHEGSVNQHLSGTLVRLKFFEGQLPSGADGVLVIEGLAGPQELIAVLAKSSHVRGGAGAGRVDVAGRLLERERQIAKRLGHLLSSG